MACIQVQVAKAAQNIGIQKIILETDVLIVKQALQAQDYKIVGYAVTGLQLKEL